MAVELATGFVSIVPTATGIAGNLTKLLSNGAATAGTVAGQQAGKGLSSGIGAGAAGVSGALKKSVVLPLLGIGIAAFASAKSVEDAEHLIIRTTGATGEAADKLKESFQNIAGRTPADFKTVSTALAEVSQRTNLTGKALEDLTLQTVTFNRITKDAPLNIQELTRTLAAFNIPAKDMGKQLDTLFKTSQKTGVPLADLISTLGSAGPIVRQFGIPIGQSAALLAQLDKAGISTAQIIPGLRKAMIGFAQAGREPGEALRSTIGQMQSLIKAGDTLAARKLATQVFGARGAGLVDAAVQGKLKLDDLQASLAKLGKGKGILDTAASTATLSAKLGILKNQAQLALAEIGKPVLEGFIGALKVAIPVVSKIAEGLKALPGPVKTALAAFTAFAVLRGPVAAFGSMIAGAATSMGGAMLSVVPAAASGSIAMQGFGATAEVTAAQTAASAASIQTSTGAMAKSGLGLAATLAIPAAVGVGIIFTARALGFLDREYKLVSTSAEHLAATTLPKLTAELQRQTKNLTGEFNTGARALVGDAQAAAMKQFHGVLAKTPQFAKLFINAMDQAGLETGKARKQLQDHIKTTLKAEEASDRYQKTLDRAKVSAKGAGDASAAAAAGARQLIAGFQVPDDFLSGLDPKTIATNLNETKAVFGDFATQALLNLGATSAGLAQLTASTAQLDESIRGSFTSATSIVGAFGEQTSITGDQFIQKQTDMVNSARDFATKLKIAMALGVDQGIVAELAAAGPKASTELDGLLAAVGQGGLTAINQNATDARTLLDGLITDVNNHAAAGYAGGLNVGGNTSRGIGDGIRNGRVNEKLDEITRKINNMPTHKRIQFEVALNTVVTGATRGLQQILKALGLAAGGPVRAGQPYIVGEQGPEFFVPEVNGRIVSHSDSLKTSNLSAAAESGATILNINGVSVVDQQAADRILAMVNLAQKRNGVSSGLTSSRAGGR